MVADLTSLPAVSVKKKLIIAATLFGFAIAIRFQLERWSPHKCVPNSTVEMRVRPFR